MYKHAVEVCRIPLSSLDRIRRENRFRLKKPTPTQDAAGPSSQNTTTWQTTKAHTPTSIYNRAKMEISSCSSSFSSPSPSSVTTSNNGAKQTSPLNLSLNRTPQPVRMYQRVDNGDEANAPVQSTPSPCLQPMRMLDATRPGVYSFRRRANQSDTPSLRSPQNIIPTSIPTIPSSTTPTKTNIIPAIGFLQSKQLDQPHSSERGHILVQYKKAGRVITVLRKTIKTRDNDSLSPVAVAKVEVEQDEVMGVESQHTSKPGVNVQSTPVRVNGILNYPASASVIIPPTQRPLVTTHLRVPTPYLSPVATPPNPIGAYTHIDTPTPGSEPRRYFPKILRTANLPQITYFADDKENSNQTDNEDQQTTSKP